MKNGCSLTAIEPPPAALEAEKGILGCILQDPNQAFPPVLEAGIGIAAFQDHRHREVFSTLARMREEGTGIDLLTVHSRLKANLNFKQVEVAALLSALENAAPSAANVSYYFPDVKAAQTRRAAWKFGAYIQSQAANPAMAPEDLQDGVEATYQTLFRPANRGLPEVVDAASFVSDHMPEPKELVQGVLHQGSKLVLGGGSKSFKTWTLLDLALSVSHGRPWLSFETVPGRVLYLNFKIQGWSWQRRLEAVAKAKGIEIEPGRLSLWNLRGWAADFATLLPKIRSYAKRGNFSLFVLDPIYKLYGQTDENKAGDVARLLNQLEELAVSTGAAVAFGAHFSKGNQASKESIDRISGSGVFARDPDSLLVFTRHEEEDAFSVEATLRNFRPVAPFVVRWQFPLFVQDAQLDPAKLKKAGGRAKEHTQDSLLEVLGNQSLSTSEWRKRAREDTGMSERTFYALKGELQKLNRVIQSKVTREWLRVSK